MKAIKKITDIADWKNPVLKQIMERRSTAKSLSLVLWLVTLIVIIMCYLLVNSASSIAKEIGEQTKTDTLYIRDTITVTITKEQCPYCNAFLPWAVNHQPKKCPSCNNYLVKPQGETKIFVLR
jgi:hypothetical protein